MCGKVPNMAGKPGKNSPARGRSAGVYGVPSALFDGVAACIPIRKSRGRIGQTARLLMAAEEGGNMSSRIFQNVIIQLKDAVDRTIGVVDEQGFVVACSELAMIGSRLDDFHLYEFDGTEHPISTGTRTYCALSSPGAKFDYAAFT